MSMSLSVVGLRNLNGEFQRHMDMKLLCDAQGYTYPAEISSYFEGMVGESERYIREEMATVDISIAISQYASDSSEGYEVDLTKLSEEVKTLRFTAGW